MKRQTKRQAKRASRANRQRHRAQKPDRPEPKRAPQPVQRRIAMPIDLNLRAEVAMALCAAAMQRVKR